MGMNECKRCEKELPDDRFNKDRSRESGLSVYCKDCLKAYRMNPKPAGWVRKTADAAAYERAYRKACREANPEKEREKDRRKYARKMLALRGLDWVPKPKLTPEEKAAREKERNRKKSLARREKDRMDPEKVKRNRARSLIQNHVYRGKIHPLPCFVCGEKAEAHHPSYDLPLDVVWLCVEHHRAAHVLTRELEKK